MPNLTLRVTLKNGALDVDQSGNANQMDHGQTGTITWELTGNAAHGSFNAMNAQHPGFAWQASTPSGVFGQPTIPPNNNNQLQVSDNNNDPNGVNSSGTWTYQLYATIGDTQYSTIVSASNRVLTTTNPYIKNN